MFDRSEILRSAWAHYWTQAKRRTFSRWLFSQSLRHEWAMAKAMLVYADLTREAAKAPARVRELRSVIAALETAERVDWIAHRAARAELSSLGF